jgi:hypothetical protein
MKVQICNITLETTQVYAESTPEMIKDRYRRAVAKCIGSLLLCDLNLQTQIRLTCRQGAKTLGKLSAKCCRIMTVTRYTKCSYLSHHCLCDVIFLEVFEDVSMPT